jgi:hypothetical protein
METHALFQEPTTTQPLVLDEPHLRLGLSADATAPDRITEAARRRLDAIGTACGSAQAVRDTIVTILVAARSALLARSRARYGGFSLSARNMTLTTSSGERPLPLGPSAACRFRAAGR